MSKIKELLIICLLFLVPAVFAFQNWYQEGNAGLKLPGANGYIAYSSNQNTLTTDISYSTCSVDGGTFAPVSADIDGDNISDIILVNGNTLYAYNQQCGLIDSIVLNFTPVTMPVIVNFDSDQWQEIVLLSDTALYFYEGSSTGSISYSNSSDFVAQLGAGQIDPFYVSCSRQDIEVNDSQICVIWKRQNTIIYWEVNQSFTLNSGILPEESANDLDIRQGSSSVFSPDTLKTTVCSRDFTSNTVVYCWVVDNDGQYNGYQLTITLLGSGDITAMYYSSSFVAKLGNLYRLFVNIDGYRGAPKSHYGVWDLNENNIFNASISGSGASSVYNTSSNWMIADYNKDGQNEACIMNTLDQTSTLTLNCYNSGFSLVSSDDYSGLFNVTKGLVMADFNSSESTLGISDGSGIYYPGKTYQQFSNNVDRNRSSIVISNPVLGAPTVVSSSDTTTFIIYNNELFAQCGNDVCDDTESAFSCPQDCGVQSDEDCLSDSDCPNSYPTCLSNKCVSGFLENSTCRFNSDCPYTSPICYAGYCISGISVNTSTLQDINDEAGDEQVIRDSFTNLVNMFTGGSSFIKFVFGILLLLASVLGLARMGIKTPFVYMIVVVFESLLFSVIGMFPWAIFIVLIISLLTLLGVNKIFQSATSE